MMLKIIDTTDVSASECFWAKCEESRICQTEK